jgi:hypothetical protein
MGEKNIAYVAFEVLKSFFFWDITPCSLTNVKRQFCRLHILQQRVRQARNQREAGSKERKKYIIAKNETEVGGKY